jgi:hypothetical protein
MSWKNKRAVLRKEKMFFLFSGGSKLEDFEQTKIKIGSFGFLGIFRALLTGENVQINERRRLAA